MALHEYMKRVVEQREVLSRSQARALLNLVLAGSTEADQPGSPHSLQLAALLGAIAARGVTAAELAGFAEAMLAAAIPVPLNDAERALLVDTCGTGGDDTGTFNISTAAALVAAAAGADAGSRMMVAIVVRSFALHQSHGHADYDLCDSTHACNCALAWWANRSPTPTEYLFSFNP